MAAILTVLLGCGVLAFTGYKGKTILQERNLWERGVTSTVTDLSGEVIETKRLIPDYNYKLKVSYKDAEGKLHRGTADFSYLFVGADEKEDVELRYDPHSPDQFVLSWQAEGGFPRWGGFLLIGALGLGCIVSAPFILGKNRKRQALLQQVAQDGKELWLEVLQLENQYGNFALTYLQPPSGEKQGKKKRENLPVAPLIIPRDGKAYALALISPQDPDTRFFVHEDLGPFSFTDVERTAIAHKLAACRSN